MKFTPLQLTGAYKISGEPFEDERGFFERWFCKEEFAKHGLETEFVQCNQSGTHGAGSIRGMHFQYPPFAEVKLVRCISGKIYDVIIDLREGSNTFLKWYGAELSAANRDALYIPQGFAHGFQVLSDYAEISYMVSNTFNKASEGGVRYNEPMVAIPWPLRANKISEKDLNIPSLQSDFSGIRL